MLGVFRLQMRKNKGEACAECIHLFNHSAFLGGAWFQGQSLIRTGEEVIIFQGAADDIDQIVWTSDEEKRILSPNRIHTVNTLG